ncbi:TonB-dependent receptor [Maribellus sp. CM-23]|uniref:TonB-dependent receptor n=1 Tax=Maribellus sp. CM-23 TaxID=2781026 RepID=UPI001F1E2EE5|nr:TonB-dependent receptor [Maribellus sp. CM-23]MCE4564780.1 TonB-dependent receptor [Maribellus sp. CM-23]
MKKFSFLLLLQVLAVVSFAQVKLSGVVLGDGEPLAGASIVIDNTFYGVSTDGSGSFEMKNLKTGDYTLKVSFIGFETKEVEVSLQTNKKIEVNLAPGSVLTDEVLVSATRAGVKTPVAYSNVSKEQLESQNLGQDIPYLLQLTPSFVATSDAGAGVGYTNFRIRGTDLNRINVTIDGIPISESESHGTWFVDIPDLASSLENVQVQRGVGTSANGAAAFGGSIDLQTNTLNKEPSAEYRTSVGSFNTFKNTVSAGTGLLDGKFTFDVRLSKVKSDGFIDRASSDLKSFFLSGGYYTKKSVLKINVFSGLEETYQSWWGVPSVRLNNDIAGMQQYEDNWLYTHEETQHMINSDSRTYNYYTYDNQIDHYQQDYYHLHFSHQFNEFLHLNTGLHYRRGRGYYENYKADQDLKEKYNIQYPVVGNDTIKSSDLVNRKWLDNDFYGGVFALNHKKDRVDFTLGGGWNTYDGDHFGNVIWAQYLGNVAPNYEWYRGNGLKKDFNIYAKFSYQLAKKLNVYTDLQYRNINYKITGIHDDLRDISQEHDYNFFNPKLGIFYQPADNQKLYASFAVANREPNRDNFVDADPNGKQPVHETLHDWEIGYNYQSSNFTAGANLYYMNYKDQLVLTGEINDVGGVIMLNVDKSYRAGLELQAGWKILRTLQWNANATFSKNKIKDFTEFVDDWDTGEQQAFDLGTTDLAFSPNFTGNSQILFTPAKNLSFSLLSNYVGKQYIDNTSNNDRVLDAYFVNNLKIDYRLTTGFFDEIVLHCMVNNLFNEKYESNAWVYSYFLGGERYKQDGYFPQAGTHFMFGVDFKF